MDEAKDNDESKRSNSNKQLRKPTATKLAV
jgi:hypothetical protein